MGDFIVSSELQKKLRPYLCGEGEVITVDEDYCAADPEPIDLDSYSWFESILPFTPYEVEFCTQFNKWYEGKSLADPKTSCKASGTSKACLDLNQKDLKLVSAKCGETIKTNQDIKDNPLTWIARLGPIALILIAVYKVLKARFGEKLKESIKDPGFFKRVRMEIKTVRQEIKEAVGIKAKAAAMLKGMVSVLRIAMGERPTKLKKDEEDAKGYYYTNRQPLIAQIEVTKTKLENLTDVYTSKIRDQLSTLPQELVETHMPNAAKLFEPGHMWDTTLEPLYAFRTMEPADIAPQIFEKMEMLDAYNNMVGLTEVNLPGIIQYDVVELAEEGAEGILRNAIQINTTLELLVSLRQTNDGMRAMVNALDPAYNKDPRATKRWGETFDRTEWFAQDAIEMLSARKAVLEEVMEGLRGGRWESAEHEWAGVRVLRAEEAPIGFTSISNIVDASTEIQKSYARNVGVTIDVKIDDDVNRIEIAHAQREPIFVIARNLINNAIRFSHPDLRNNGAYVRVSAYIQPEYGQHYIALKVEDNGVGIEDLDAAFASKKLLEPYGGKGGGLVEAQEMIARAGAAIHYKTSTAPDDHGTTFIIIVSLGEKLPPGGYWIIRDRLRGMETTSDDTTSSMGVTDVATMTIEGGEELYCSMLQGAGNGSGTNNPSWWQGVVNSLRPTATMPAWNMTFVAP